MLPSLSLRSRCRVLPVHRLSSPGTSKQSCWGTCTRRKTILVPEIAASGKEATAWVEPVKDEWLAFRTVGQSENVNLIPLHKLFNERYTVYWKVNGKTA